MPTSARWAVWVPLRRGRHPRRPANRRGVRNVRAAAPCGAPPGNAGGGKPPPYGRQSASFVGADIIRPPSPYRKLLPKLNSACFPKRADAFGSPAGGFHILGGSKFRLRQGFAGRNAWTPHGGGSLRSQEQAGRHYRKLLPKLNSACFPKRAGAFGSPAGGFHILGGSKSRLRQGFAGRNAWTPHGGGSLRSQEQAGRRYRKLLPKLNSACSLVSSPMV